MFCFACANIAVLDDLDVGGLFTLGADTAVEGHALVFRQAAEAVGLDVLEVREDVSAASIRSDEAEALGIVEPFDYAGLSAHVCFLWKSLGRMKADA